MSGVVGRRLCLALGCWLVLVSPVFAGKPDAPPSPAPVLHANVVLNPAAVTKLLAAALQKQFVSGDGRLELRLTTPWQTITAPAGPLTVKILQMPNSGLASYFLVGFEIITPAGRRLGPWQCPVQAHLWRKVWVARSLLQPGTPLADADVARERRDVLALHMPLAQFAAGDATLEVAESVPAGAPLPAYAVKLRPVIHRGQMANALVQDGVLRVSTQVKALEDGVPGQIIHVRNLRSDRDFCGKVLDDKTILVPL